MLPNPGKNRLVNHENSPFGFPFYREGDDQTNQPALRLADWAIP
jgi:hypothetical protein